MPRSLLDNALRNALSRSVGGGGVVRAPRKRVAPSDTRDAFAPSMRDFRRYVLAVDGDERSNALFSSLLEKERWQRETLAGDASVFDSDRFDGKYYRALKRALDLGAGSFDATKFSKAFESQMVVTGGSATANRRWRKTFVERDLGRFEEDSPLFVRVSCGSDDSRNFGLFVEEHGARFARVDLAPLLLARGRASAVETALSRRAAVDSCSRSVFYRRIYLTHVFLWGVVCEGERTI